MSSYLTIKWFDAKPGEMAKPPAAAMPITRLQMAVDGFACVKDATAKKMPSLIFVFSEAKEKRGSGMRALLNADKDKPGNEDLTPAAKSSLAIYERVLDNIQDIPLRVLSRFFRCTRMDVTKVPVGTHPDIVEANAPLVLLVDAQGKVAQILSQTRIDSRSLTLGMVDVLKKNGLGNIETLCNTMIKLMDEMEQALVAKNKIELKMAELKTSLAECEAKDRKRPNKTGVPLPPSTGTIRAKQAVDALQPSLDAAEQVCTAVKDRDVAMLVKAGVDLTAPPPPTASASTTASTPIAASPYPSPAVRTWTSASGKTVEGRFSQLQMGMVFLAKPDGEIVRIHINMLSPGDQAVVRQLATSRSP